MPTFDPDDPESQAVRRPTLQNDVRVRDQRNGDTSAYIHHYSSDDAGGRFAQVNAARVVGASGDIAAQYPACSSPLAVQLPDEPPLDSENPALDETSASPASAEVGDPAAAPPSDNPLNPSGELGVERAGSLLRKANK